MIDELDFFKWKISIFFSKWKFLWIVEDLEKFCGVKKSCWINFLRQLSSIKLFSKRKMNVKLNSVNINFYSTNRICLVSVQMSRKKSTRLDNPFCRWIGFLVIKLMQIFSNEISVKFFTVECKNLPVGWKLSGKISSSINKTRISKVSIGRGEKKVRQSKLPIKRLNSRTEFQINSTQSL